MSPGSRGPSEEIPSVRPVSKEVVAAALAALSTTLPFAVGILKNGLIEVLLLVPVAWFLVTSRKDRAAPALLLLVSVCLTATICDLILRPILGARLHYSPMNQYQRRLPALPMLGRWDALVNFSGPVYGDLAAMTGDPAFREPRHIEFRTDALGFRNNKVPAAVDVIVLGDSFAAGVGVTQTGTLAPRLAARYGLSVYNLSYPGGPYDQFINFSLEVPKLMLAAKAELVWTLFAGNDLEDDGGEIWEIEALPWQRGLSSALVAYRTFRGRSPLRQGWNALRSRWRGISQQVIVRALPDGRPLLFYGPHEVWGERPRAEVERHPNFAKLRKTLQAMRAATDRMGVEVFVVLLPTKGEVYRELLNPQAASDASGPSGFAEAVLGACRDAGLRCRDSKPYLRETARRLYAASQDLLWWRDDTHINESGHQAIASFVAEELRQTQGLGPLQDHDERS